MVHLRTLVTYSDRTVFNFLLQVALFAVGSLSDFDEAAIDECEAAREASETIRVPAKAHRFYHSTDYEVFYLKHFN